MNSDKAFACNMDALDSAERMKHTALTKELLHDVRAIRELDDGYAFDLPVSSGTLENAAQFVANERLCCPFFRFAIIMMEDGSGLSLTITGTQGVKEFQRAEFGTWVQCPFPNAPR